MARQFRFGIVIIALFLSVLATRPIAAQTAGNTALIVSGPSSDPITGGGNYYYLPSNGTFTVSNPGLDGIRVVFRGVNVQIDWSLFFYPPVGEMLEVADYENCQRFPGETTGGIDISAFGIGCDHLSGSFIVHELVRDLDGVVEAFHISFQQSCFGTDSPLAGEIFYNSSHQLPPAPIPAPTAKPGQLSVISVSVSPKQIVEGADATFTFTAKPAPAVPLNVGLNEIDLTDRQVSFASPGEIKFGPGVSTITVPLHTHADAMAQKKTKYTVQIIRVPIYKVGKATASVKIVDAPH